MAERKLPLTTYLQVQQVTDAEIRQVMADTAREAGRIVRTTGGVRGAQAKLAAAQVKAWAAVGDLTRVGIGDAVDAASNVQSVYDEELFRAAGINSQYWRMANLAQARAGINNLISRKENGITLSQRVYRNRALASGNVDRVLNSGIALGKSAREIAKDVEKFIDPNVAGGPSYAAMRLARSELNNAFHTTSRKQYAENPFVQGVKWNLSGSHPRPDECNQYADSQHYRGGDPGVFRPGDVPGKPHPNCLCFTTPIEEDLDSFINNVASGKYDKHFESRGCGYLA